MTSFFSNFGFYSLDKSNAPYREVNKNGLSSLRNSGWAEKSKELDTGSGRFQKTTYKITLSKPYTSCDTCLGTTAATCGAVVRPLMYTVTAPPTLATTLPTSFLCGMFGCFFQCIEPGLVVKSAAQGGYINSDGTHRMNYSSSHPHGRSAFLEDRNSPGDSANCAYSIATCLLNTNKELLCCVSPCSCPCPSDTLEIRVQIPTNEYTECIQPKHPKDKEDTRLI